MVTFDATDLDNAAVESGVVHESVANTDHDNASELKQGYSVQNPYLASDLVGYWPQYTGPDTAEDFSGNDNDGTVNGATEADGLLGTSAYSFDGTDDYIDIPDGTFDSFTTGSFTVAFWFKTSYTSDQTLIYPHGDADIRFNISAFASDRLSFQIYDGTTTYVSSNESVNDGEWHFAVGVFDSANTQMELFVDGVSQGTATSNNPISGIRRNVFGYNTGGNSQFYNGRLGAVWAWDTALSQSQSQIQTLYDVVATSGTLATQWKQL